MSLSSIDPTSFRSLAILVESVAIPLLREHRGPVCLEVDIDRALEVPGDARATVELIQALTRQSLAVMPEGGDLVITACETENGLELELADTGADVDARPRNLPMVAATLGVEIRWQNCPQGGGAVTATFPRRSGDRRMAA